MPGERAMRLIIVKYADDFFPNKEEPLRGSLSVHESYTAKKVNGNKPFYESNEEAEAVLRELNVLNPTVYYGIRPMLEE